MSAVTPSPTLITGVGSEASSTLNTADANNAAKAPHILVVDPATGLPITPALDGIDSSDANATQAASGVGIRGWLSTLVSLFRAGTARVIMRGGAKGTTTAADVTSTAVDANTQALHVATMTALPAGTNTIGAFKQTDGTNTQAITATGAAKVDGSAVTQPVSGAVTATSTGNVASGATDSGNPLKVGGVYNSTTPTLTTGQRGDAQLDTHGNLKVNARTTGRVYPSNAARGGSFALTGAGVFNDVLTFSSTVNSVFVQNNAGTAINIYCGSGTAPASGNVSFLYDTVIPGGTNDVIQLNETCDWVAIYGSSGTKTNQGTASTGLVVYGLS